MSMACGTLLYRAVLRYAVLFSTTARYSAVVRTVTDIGCMHEWAAICRSRARLSVFIMCGILCTDDKPANALLVTCTAGAQTGSEDNDMFIARLVFFSFVQGVRADGTTPELHPKPG